MDNLVLLKKNDLEEMIKQVIFDLQPVRVEEQKSTLNINNRWNI